MTQGDKQTFTTKIERPEEQLTEEQKQTADAGSCPLCSGAMTKLIPAQFPIKAEWYCAACHFSFPLFKR